MASWLTLLALGLPAPIAAEPSLEPGSQPGRIVDPVICATARDHSYALYLPSAYTPQRKWPILFLFDSEGRGAELAERLRPAAETHGFVLASSNNASSDTPWEINQRAVRLLLADVFRHVSIDERRLHFGGFSGTARLAWAAGTGFRDAVAGVLLLGGTTPGDELPEQAPPFPVFATVGREDFNYLEVRRLEARLLKLGAAHRVVTFDGGHTWPPEAVLIEALGWLRLHAQRAGRAAPDEDLVRHLMAEDLDRALQAEGAGELLAAWGRYRAIARDFAGLADTDSLERILSRLQAEPELRRGRAAEERTLKEEETYREEIAWALRGFTSDRRPPQTNRLLSDLKIARLQQRAGSAPDPEGARAARRMLERAFVHTSLDLPEALLGQRDYRRAAASLSVAAAIHPGDPELWFRLARARTLAGTKALALEALAAAVEHGFVDLERLQSEAALEPLRDAAAYRVLMERLSAPRSDPGRP